MHENEQTQQLLDELERKEAQLAVAYESLSLFTKAISHDLHSPINTLNQLLGILHEGHNEQLDEDGQELLQMSMTSATRNLELTSGLLEYSKTCRPSRDRTEIDSAAIIADVLLALDEKIEQQGITVVVNELPVLVSHAQALTTVFTHLIDNALKFNPSDNAQRTITISGARSAENTEFLIEDQGIGIEPKRTGDLFKPLARLTTRAEYAGAGLGLSLCTVIVQALDGRLWVTPAEPEGCVLHMSLPHIPATPG